MTPRQAEMGVHLFTGAVVISVAVALAGLTWRLTGDPGTSIMAAPAVSKKPTVNLVPIVGLAPFGVPAGSAATGAGDTLQLRAVFLATPAEASTALIAIDGGVVKAFRIGESVNGATLEKVTRDNVTLLTVNGLQSLAFPTASAITQSAASTGQPVAAPKTGALSGVDAIRALIPQSARGNGPSARSVNVPAPSQPSSLAPNGSSSAAPQTSGYRVGSESLPAIFAAGLRPGDVVERINGTALGDSDQDRQTVMRAMSTGSAQVEIVREGRRMSLSVPVR